MQHVSCQFLAEFQVLQLGDSNCPSIVHQQALDPSAAFVLSIGLPLRDTNPRRFPPTAPSIACAPLNICKFPFSRMRTKQ